jgi:VWFA-related protein
MKKRLCAAALIAVIVLSAGSGLAGLPQEKKPGQDVIKISSELVQVDVVVTDKNNKPVKGLKREDFELYDNEKRQNISHFFFEEIRPRQIDDTEQPRSLPRAITARELKRVLAFVVDTLHMKFDSVHRTRKMLEDFINTRMEPGDLVLIIPTGGGSGLYQQFTADQRLLRRAIARLRPFIIGTDAQPRRSLTAFGLPPMLPGPRGPGLQIPSGGGQRGLNTIDPLEEFDVRATLSTLNNIVKAMSKLPGRKVSVFISEGFRVAQTQTNLDLRETTERAARANVVVYSIDPKGLDSLGIGAGEDIGDQDVTTVLSQKRDDHYDAQNSLNALAKDTGGEFYRDTNDIKRGLDNLLEENSAYYVLGFQPEEGRWDGKYHKLKVVVRGRADLTVSTRRGYVARTEKAIDRKIADPRVAEMAEAISSPLVRRDIDLQLTPFYRDDEKREPQLVTLLHIDASQLSFKQVEGRHKAQLEVTGYLLDAAGRAVDRFSNTVDLNLQPETYQEMMKRGLLSTRQAAVKPGVYQLRMFVREAESGLIGTANNFVEVPNMKGDRLAVSSIFTDSRSVEEGRVVESGGEKGTLSQRRFRREGKFAYSMVIYNAKTDKNETQLEMRIRVYRGLQVVFNGMTRPVQVLAGSTPPSRIITGGVITLGELPPDDYTLEVTIFDRLRKRESRGVVRQEIDFSVE